MDRIILGEEDFVLKQVTKKTSQRLIFESVFKELEFGSVPKKLYNKLTQITGRIDWVWKIHPENEKLPLILKANLLLCLAESEHRFMIDFSQDSKEEIELQDNFTVYQKPNEFFQDEEAVFEMILSTFP